MRVLFGLGLILRHLLGISYHSTISVQKKKKKNPNYDLKHSPSVDFSLRLHFCFLIPFAVYFQFISHFTRLQIKTQPRLPIHTNSFLNVSNLFNGYLNATKQNVLYYLKTLSRRHQRIKRHLQELTSKYKHTYYENCMLPSSSTWPLPYILISFTIYMCLQLLFITRTQY